MWGIVLTALFGMAGGWLACRMHQHGRKIDADIRLLADLSEARAQLAHADELIDQFVAELEARDQAPTPAYERHVDQALQVAEPTPDFRRIV